MFRNLCWEQSHSRSFWRREEKDLSRSGVAYQSFTDFPRLAHNWLGLNHRSQLDEVPQQTG